MIRNLNKVFYKNKHSLYYNREVGGLCKEGLVIAFVATCEFEQMYNV